MTEHIYSVHELNLQIKEVLKLNWPRPIKIEGEISNFKVTRGNLFMTLKDNTAKVDVIWWGYSDKNDGTKLENGKQVVVHGRLTCWDKKGQYQITAFNIQVKGLGDLHAEFLKIKDKYEKNGYFDSKFKKKLGDSVKKVGVATAVGGAALKDFLYVLEKNGYNGQVYIKGCVVQGKDCPSAVAKAILELDKMELDVIVITRGGGSYEDLFGFSNPEIIEAVHKAKTCVMSAVGHEVDNMLSDFVADIRAPTPSVAGEFIALHQKDKTNLDEFYNLCQMLDSEIKSQLYNLQIQIQEYESMVDDPSQLIDRYSSEFDSLLSGLSNELTNTLNEYIIELREMNFEIDSTNPTEILKNGYVMIVDNDTDEMIKTSVELSFLKDLAEENKKLKLIFNDQTVIVDLSSINISRENE